MFKKIIYFIKYNNLVALILVVIFLAGTGVFAQTETGQAVIGAQERHTEGVDNTLLINADLEKLDMDYKIERIEEDDKYYYVIYTYIDLARQGNAWVYLMQEKTRKVTKDLKEDLGQYLAEELMEEYEARIRDLIEEQVKALEAGEETRVEVTEYSGLIGQTLELAGKIFPGYEPVKRYEIPSPSIPPNILFADTESAVSIEDDLTDIYNEYINENDPDRDNVFGILDNCPDIYNPDQLDSNNDGVGDVCVEAEEEDEPVEDDDSETATTTEEIIEEPVDEEPSEESIEEEVTEPAEEQLTTEEPKPTSTEEASPDTSSDVIIVPDIEVEIIELE